MFNFIYSMIKSFTTIQMLKAENEILTSTIIQNCNKFNLLINNENIQSFIHENDIETLGEQNIDRFTNGGSIFKHSRIFDEDFCECNNERDFKGLFIDLYTNSFLIFLYKRSRKGGYFKISSDEVENSLIELITKEANKCSWEVCNARIGSSN